MRSFAHVEERSVAVEGQGVEAVLLHEFLGVFALVGLPHVVEPDEGFVERDLLLVEALALLEDLLHAPLELGKVDLGEGLGQDEVVVEPVLDRWTEAEGRTFPHFEHGLGQDMGETVPDPVELIVAFGFV